MLSRSRAGSRATRNSTGSPGRTPPIASPKVTAKRKSIQGSSNQTSPKSSTPKTRSKIQSPVAKPQKASEVKSPQPRGRSVQKKVTASSVASSQSEVGGDAASVTSSQLDEDTAAFDSKCTPSAANQLTSKSQVRHIRGKTSRNTSQNTGEKSDSVPGSKVDDHSSSPRAKSQTRCKTLAKKATTSGQSTKSEVRAASSESALNVTKEFSPKSRSRGKLAKKIVTSSGNNVVEEETSTKPRPRGRSAKKVSTLSGTNSTAEEDVSDEVSTKSEKQGPEASPSQPLRGGAGKSRFSSNRNLSKSCTPLGNLQGKKAALSPVQSENEVTTKGKKLKQKAKAETVEFKARPGQRKCKGTVESPRVLRKNRSGEQSITVKELTAESSTESEDHSLDRESVNSIKSQATVRSKGPFQAVSKLSEEIVGDQPRKDFSKSTPKNLHGRRVCDRSPDGELENLNVSGKSRSRTEKSLKAQTPVVCTGSGAQSNRGRPRKETKGTKTPTIVNKASKVDAGSETETVTKQTRNKRGRDNKNGIGKKVVSSVLTSRKSKIVQAKGLASKARKLKSLTTRTLRSKVSESHSEWEDEELLSEPSVFAKLSDSAPVKTNVVEVGTVDALQKSAKQSASEVVGKHSVLSGRVKKAAKRNSVNLRRAWSGSRELKALSADPGTKLGRVRGGRLRDDKQLAVLGHKTLKLKGSVVRKKISRSIVSDSQISGSTSQDDDAVTVTSSAVHSDQSPEVGNKKPQRKRPSPAVRLRCPFLAKRKKRTGSPLVRGNTGKLQKSTSDLDSSLSSEAETDNIPESEKVSKSELKADSRRSIIRAVKRQRVSVSPETKKIEQESAKHVASDSECASVEEKQVSISKSVGKTPRRLSSGKTLPVLAKNLTAIERVSKSELPSVSKVTKVTKKKINPVTESMVKKSFSLKTIEKFRKAFKLVDPVKSGASSKASIDTSSAGSVDSDIALASFVKHKSAGSEKKELSKTENYAEILEVSKDLKSDRNTEGKMVGVGHKHLSSEDIGKAKVAGLKYSDHGVCAGGEVVPEVKDNLDFVVQVGNVDTDTKMSLEKSKTVVKEDEEVSDSHDSENIINSNSKVVESTLESEEAMEVDDPDEEVIVPGATIKGTKDSASTETKTKDNDLPEKDDVSSSKLEEKPEEIEDAGSDEQLKGLDVTTDVKQDAASRGDPMDEDALVESAIAKAVEETIQAIMSIVEQTAGESRKSDMVQEEESVSVDCAVSSKPVERADLRKAVADMSVNDTENPEAPESIKLDKGPNDADTNLKVEADEHASEKEPISLIETSPVTLNLADEIVVSCANEDTVVATTADELSEAGCTPHGDGAMVDTTSDVGKKYIETDDDVNVLEERAEVSEIAEDLVAKQSALASPEKMAIECPVTESSLTCSHEKQEQAPDEVCQFEVESLRQSHIEETKCTYGALADAEQSKGEPSVTGTIQEKVLSNDESLSDSEKLSSESCKNTLAFASHTVASDLKLAIDAEPEKERCTTQAEPNKVSFSRSEGSHEMPASDAEPYKEQCTTLAESVKVTISGTEDSQGKSTSDSEADKEQYRTVAEPNKVSVSNDEASHEMSLADAKPSKEQCTTQVEPNKLSVSNNEVCHEKSAADAETSKEQCTTQVETISSAEANKEQCITVAEPDRVSVSNDEASHEESVVDAKPSKEHCTTQVEPNKESISLTEASQEKFASNAEACEEQCKTESEPIKVLISGTVASGEKSSSDAETNKEHCTTQVECNKVSVSCTGGNHKVFASDAETGEEQCTTQVEPNKVSISSAITSQEKSADDAEPSQEQRTNETESNKVSISTTEVNEEHSASDTEPSSKQCTTLAEPNKISMSDAEVGQEKPIPESEPSKEQNTAAAEPNKVSVCDANARLEKPATDAEPSKESTASGDEPCVEPASGTPPSKGPIILKIKTADIWKSDNEGSATSTGSLEPEETLDDTTVNDSVVVSSTSNISPMSKKVKDALTFVNKTLANVSSNGSEVSAALGMPKIESGRVSDDKLREETVSSTEEESVVSSSKSESPAVHSDSGKSVSCTCHPSVQQDKSVQPGPSHERQPNVAAEGNRSECSPSTKAAAASMSDVERRIEEIQAMVSDIQKQIKTGSSPGVGKSGLHRLDMDLGYQHSQIIHHSGEEGDLKLTIRLGGKKTDTNKVLLDAACPRKSGSGEKPYPRRSVPPKYSDMPWVEYSDSYLQDMERKHKKTLAKLEKTEEASSSSVNEGRSKRKPIRKTEYELYMYELKNSKRRKTKSTLSNTSSSESLTDALEGDLKESNIPGLLKECKPCNVVLVDFVTRLNLGALKKRRVEEESSEASLEKRQKLSLETESGGAEIDAETLVKQLTPEKKRHSSGPKRRSSGSSSAGSLASELESGRLSPGSPRAIDVPPNRLSPKPRKKKINRTGFPKPPRKYYYAYQCKFCPYSTNYRIAMEDHVYTHLDVVPFKCGYCNDIFGAKSGAVAHHKRNHQNLPLRCIKSVDVDESQYYNHVYVTGKGKYAVSGSNSTGMEGQKTRNVFESMMKEIPGKELPATTLQPQVISSTQNICLLPVAAASNVRTSPVKTPIQTGSLQIQKNLPAQIPQSSPVNVQPPQARPQLSTRPKSPRTDKLPVYQCKFCNFSTDHRNIIEAHLQNLHDEEYRFICPLCDLAFCKREETMVKHFKKWHPGRNVIFKRAPGVKTGQEQGSETPASVSMSYEAAAGRSLQPNLNDAQVSHCEKKAQEVPRIPIAGLSTSAKAASSNTSTHQPQAVLNIPKLNLLLQKQDSPRSSSPSLDPSRKSGKPTIADIADSLASKAGKLSMPVGVSSSASQEGGSAAGSDQDGSRFVQSSDKRGGILDLSFTQTSAGVASEADPANLKIVNVVSLSTSQEKMKPSPVVSEQTVTLFGCKTCKQEFDGFDNVIKHIELMHSQMDFWFACPYCPYGCSKHRGNMVRHIKRAHPMKAMLEVDIHLIDEARYISKRQVVQKSGKQGQATEMLTSGSSESVAKGKAPPLTQMVRPMISTPRTIPPPLIRAVPAMQSSTPKSTEPFVSSAVNPSSRAESSATSTLSSQPAQKLPQAFGLTSMQIPLAVSPGDQRPPSAGNAPTGEPKLKKPPPSVRQENVMPTEQEKFSVFNLRPTNPSTMHTQTGQVVSTRMPQIGHVPFSHPGMIHSMRPEALRYNHPQGNVIFRPSRPPPSS